MNEAIRRTKLQVQLAGAEDDLRAAKETQRLSNDPKAAAKKREAAERVARFRNELRSM